MTGTSEQTAQERAIEAIRAAAESITGEHVTVGLLPQSGGIAFQIAAGYPEFVSLDRKNRRRSVTLDFLAKFGSQIRAYGVLCELGNTLDTTDFEESSVVSATVKSDPKFVGKDGDMWIYSLSVDLRIQI